MNMWHGVMIIDVHKMLRNRKWLVGCLHSLE